MTITCFNCSNQCCSCTGCQPVFVNNNWYCPRCASFAQPNSLSIARSTPGTYQATAINNNNWQLISSNYLKRR